MVAMPVIKLEVKKLSKYMSKEESIVAQASSKLLFFCYFRPLKGNF